MLTDRVVLISGAAGGVGSVLVSRFLDNGDTVLATDTRQDALDTWRVRFDAEAALSTFAGDISAEADTVALAQAARERHGRVDVLVNCAGYFPIIPFDEMSVGDWRTVIDVNLTGSFLTVWAPAESPPPRHHRQYLRRVANPQYTAIDDCTHLRVLPIYPRSDQETAIQFLDYVVSRPQVEKIQTDNDAEFQSSFHRHVIDQGIGHTYIHPTALSSTTPGYSTT